MTIDPKGALYSYGQAINDFGQVTGYYEDSKSEWHGFVAELKAGAGIPGYSTPGFENLGSSASMLGDFTYNQPAGAAELNSESWQAASQTGLLPHLSNEHPFGLVPLLNTTGSA